jgi:hypothetical protein
MPSPIQIFFLPLEPDPSPTMSLGGWNAANPPN